MTADPLASSPTDYLFGPYRFDGKLRSLFKDDELVVLTPKAADTLSALLERAGRVVERDELFRAVWGDVVVSDDTLAQNISTLRRALGDDASRPRFIVTIARHGYRFVAPVHAASANAATGSAQEAGRMLWPLLGVIAVLAGLAGSLTQSIVPRDRPRAVVQFTIDEPEHWRFSAGGGMLALSPNGEYLAFIAGDVAGSSALWVRPLASAVSHVIAGTEAAANPFWSPDSRTIGFFSERRLKAVDVASSAVRVVASLASPRSLGGTWSAGGRILFSVANDGMYLVAASGGVPERLAPQPNTECCGAWPQFLPDGRHFLYTVSTSEPSAVGVYVAEIGTRQGHRLVDAVSSSTWVSPGFLSFARSGTLYLQPFDMHRLRVVSAPIPVADSVAYNVRTGRTSATTSDAGVVAFRKSILTELVWVDRAGTVQSVAAPPGLYGKFSIAPDGRRVAAARLDPGTGNSDVWVFDGGREVRVTEHPDWDSDPVWSDDGRHVVYSARRGKGWQIYRRAVTAIGGEELLLDTDSPVTPLQVLRSTDLLYAAQPTMAAFDVWKLARAHSTPLTRAGGFYPSDARLSPDERWLAFGVPETTGNVGEQALYVSGSPFREGRREIARAASLPRWRADGQELFYLAKDSSIVALAIDPARTPSDDGTGTVLFRAPGPSPTGITGNVYDVTPDGQRFLVKREVGSSPIHVVLNWDARR
jgi:eukaryotic-like serine/threonine-protein kinase